MLKINVEISIDSDQAYSPLEAGIVAALSGNAPAAAAAKAAPVVAKPAAAAQKAEPVAKAAPAKAAPAAAPKAAAKPVAKPEPVAEEEAPTLQEELAGMDVDNGEDEDLLGTAETSKTYTLEEAVAEATTRVSTGDSQSVKEALASLGVKRVSELKTPKAINAFMSKLNG